MRTFESLVSSLPSSFHAIMDSTRKSVSSLLLIALIVGSIGCGSRPPLYDKALERGKMGDISGKWIGGDLLGIYTLTVEGTQIKVAIDTGIWAHTDDYEEITKLTQVKYQDPTAGDIRGGLVYFPGRFDSALIPNEDGVSARWHRYTGGESGRFLFFPPAHSNLTVNKDPLVRYTLSDVTNSPHVELKQRYPDAQLLVPAVPIDGLSETMFALQYRRAATGYVRVICMVPISEAGKVLTFLSGVPTTLHAKILPPEVRENVGGSGEYALYTPKTSVLTHLQSLPELEKGFAGSPYYGRISKSIDGTPTWWIMRPHWKKGDTVLRPSGITVELYDSDPAGGPYPVDMLTVAARNAAGAWENRPTYASRFSTPVRVAAHLKPAGSATLSVEVIETPPLLEFLYFRTQPLREHEWQNTMLLRIKNRSIPQMTREWKTSALRDSVEKVESAILNLNRQADKASLQARMAVEKGEGDPTPLRRLSVIYKERIEILKPILKALRTEITNRDQ